MIDKKLNLLEEMKVITPIAYSQSAEPIVVAKNVDGSVPLSADFSIGFNTVHEELQYILPLPDNLFTILNSGT